MKKLSPADVSMYLSITLLPINQYSIVDILKILKRNNIEKYKYDSLSVRINMLCKNNLYECVDNIKSLMVELSNIVENVCIYLSFRINNIDEIFIRKNNIVKSINIPSRKITRSILCIDNRYYLLEHLSGRKAVSIKRLNVRKAEYIDLRMIPQGLFVFCSKPVYVAGYVYDSVKDLEEIMKVYGG